MSVRTARLGDIADDLRSGFACGIDDPNGTIQFRMNNIERDGTLNWTKIRRVPMKKIKEELTLKSGDILLNVTNSPDLVGKTALFKGADEAMTFSNHFLRLRTRVDWAEPAYVARWLRRQFELGCFKAMCRSWVNQASVTRDQISNLEIPLPPLDEQRRIAAILDKADSLRQKRKQAIALLDSLTQSIFLEMFGELTSLSGPFKAGVVADWVADFSTGKNLAADPDNANETSYRVLKVSAVTKGVFDPDESKPLPSSYRPPVSHLVKNGDLLFSRANTSELIGATALVRGDHSRLVLPDKIWRFAWQPKNEPNSIFIQGLFSSPKFRIEISKRASGTSGSMKNISKQKVLGIPVQIPPRTLQDQYSDRVVALQRSLDAAVAQYALSEDLFASLQHRAFTGEL